MKWVSSPGDEKTKQNEILVFTEFSVPISSLFLIAFTN